MEKNQEREPACSRVTGGMLISWGYEPSASFSGLITLGNRLLEEGLTLEEVQSRLEKHQVATSLNPYAGHIPGDVSVGYLIEGQTEYERENIASLKETVVALQQVPTVESIAIMPDACPAGPVGTIPVGGIVAAENAIHPAFHSADVCCSVMLTEFTGASCETLYNIAKEVTHFGPRGRSKENQFELDEELFAQCRDNDFLDDPKILRSLRTHLGTQGDGNHFLYIGTRKSTGNPCVVTHHGSRAPGAGLYRKGVREAQRYVKNVGMEQFKKQAWIPADTEKGQSYWEALQLIRSWTKLNHQVLHEAIGTKALAETVANFWNEHNFVFRRGDVYYHGKGATPGWIDFSLDSSGLTLVPLNMAAPILITKGLDNPKGLGFLPHGAGRNLSRTQFKKQCEGLTLEQLVEKDAAGIQLTFFCDGPDISELPSAYKNHHEIIRQIEDFKLAEIVDLVEPYGTIMAGWVDYQKRADRSLGSVVQ